MRKFSLAFVTFLGVGLTILIQIFFRYQINNVKAEGSTIYISVNDPICGENSPCFSNIQEAVSAAVSGDTILVSSGVYTDTDVAILGF